MASILKNQIIKYLSRFTKNLSTNSISLSTLKGEGELNNLELDEKILTELLELPNWMLISQASVNKVSIKIPWTKLKTAPIHLVLDEVCIQIETVKELRPQSATPESSLYKAAKYGYVEKVIDGITVHINFVKVKFKSDLFVTTLQLSKISICSKSPTWQSVDLRCTRLKDVRQEHVLVFKEIHWHALKIESKSSDTTMTPLRLITNQSCCRLTVKKKLSDCSIIGCRLVLLSEELLWILTNSQILSAYHLIESLSDLIKKSTEQGQKEKALRKLESIESQNVDMFNLNEKLGTVPNAKNRSSEKSKVMSQATFQKHEYYKRFDVVETSYHFFCEKIDLHFIDDVGPGRSTYPDLDKGGTLQLSIDSIKVDFYPYHPALGERTHWIRYVPGSINYWTKLSLSHFKTELINYFNSKKFFHSPLERATQYYPAQAATVGSQEQTNEGAHTGKSFVLHQLSRLMSSCVVFSYKNFILYQVASSKRKCTMKQMISRDDARYVLPADTPLVQMEFISFFYPGEFQFPVPAPKIFCQVNPLKIDLHASTCLWLNAFVGNVAEKILVYAKTRVVGETEPNLNVNGKNLEAKVEPPYMDIQLEVIMPRIIIKPILKPKKEKDRPRCLQICTSRAIISNVRSPDPTLPGSKASLFTCLEDAQKYSFFFGSEFPTSTSDQQAIASKFLHHAQGSDIIDRSPGASGISVPPRGSFQGSTCGYPVDALWTEPRDVFFIHCENIELQFLNKDDDNLEKVFRFIHPFEASVWIYIKDLSPPVLSLCEKDISKGSCISLENENSQIENVSCRIILHVPNFINLQFTHLQFLFLMRLLDAAAEFSTYLNEDIRTFQANQEITLIAAVLSGVSVSMLGPSDVSIPITATNAENFEDTNTPSLASPNFPKDVSACVAHTVMGSANPIVCLSSNMSPTDENHAEAGALSKSHSDGCLSQTLSESLPNNLNLKPPKSLQINLSKSGENFMKGSDKDELASLSRRSSTRSSISSVRKGITNSFQSLKVSIENVGSVKSFTDDISDTVSLRSDLSNESDTFIMLNIESSNDNLSNNIDCSFFKHTKRKSLEHFDDIEAAEEALDMSEEIPPSISEPSEPSTLNKVEKAYATVTFILSRVNFVLESQGHDSFIKLESNGFTSDVSQKIFQSEIDKKLKNIDNEFGPVVFQPSNIKLRLDTRGKLIEVPPDNLSNALPYYLENRYSYVLPIHRESSLYAIVSNLSLDLPLVSMTLLGDLMQEEIDPIPVPMKIDLNNVSVSITDTKSNLKQNCQTFNISDLKLSRNIDFVFSLSSFTDIDKPISSFSRVFEDASINSSQTTINRTSSDFTSNLNSGSTHENCLDKVTELLNQIDKLEKKLLGAERENANLMKALTILHQDQANRTKERYPNTEV